MASLLGLDEEEVALFPAMTDVGASLDAAGLLKLCSHTLDISHVTSPWQEM